MALITFGVRRRDESPPRPPRPIPRLQKVVARMHPSDHAKLVAIAEAGDLTVEQLAEQVLVSYTHRSVAL